MPINKIHKLQSAPLLISYHPKSVGYAVFFSIRVIITALARTQQYRAIHHQVALRLQSANKDLALRGFRAQAG